MKQRYRLKLTVTGATGNLAWILRIFPNALVFVGYPSTQQLELVVAASGILSAFGVTIEVTPS